MDSFWKVCASIWNCIFHIIQHVFSLVCQFGVRLLCAVYLCKICIESESFLMDFHVLFSYMACGGVPCVLIHTTLEGGTCSFPFADRISRAKEDSDQYLVFEDFWTLCLKHQRKVKSSGLLPFAEWWMKGSCQKRKKTKVNNYNSTAVHRSGLL